MREASVVRAHAFLLRICLSRVGPKGLGDALPIDRRLGCTQQCGSARICVFCASAAAVMMHACLAVPACTDLEKITVTGCACLLTVVCCCVL